VTPATPNPYQGPPPGLWYGMDAAWRTTMQAEARRRYGDALSATLGPDTLTYRLAGLDVISRPDPVPVSVVFRDQGTRWGQPAWDMPEVFADPRAASKHRNGDDSLCLYFPWDPQERRWHSELGLGVLFDLVADHLFAELHWRNTGGANGGVWVLDEAPHGLPEGGVA